MKHKKSETPAYRFFINERPSLHGKGKTRFIDNVRKSAKKNIRNPIKSYDIEIEIVYSTSVKDSDRMDIDNINKPLLDALQGIAFNDDKQVRAISSTLFDKKKNAKLEGRVEYMGDLFYTKNEHVLLISIYSDSRLSELGGESKIEKIRFQEWQEEHNKKLKRLTNQSNES